MSEITATKEQQNKYEALKEYLRSLGSVAVAFSSGVDSTFLLKTAHDVLGDKCIAITAMSCSFPKRELEEAKAFCGKEGIRHITVESEELEIEGFCQNPTNRCYICKEELFEKIWEIARKEAECSGRRLQYGRQRRLQTWFTGCCRAGGEEPAAPQRIV